MSREKGRDLFGSPPRLVQERDEATIISEKRQLQTRILTLVLTLTLTILAATKIQDRRTLLRERNVFLTTMKRCAKGRFPGDDHRT